MALIKLNLAQGVTGTLPTSNYTAGITEYDVWRLTADVTTRSQVITSNLARTTVLGFQKIGTGMSESSGIFTFSGTGIWEVYARFNANNGANKVRSCTCQIQYTSNNSSYAQVVAATGNMYDDGTENTYFTGDAKFTFDITDTANQKVRFNLLSDDNSSTFTGSTSTTNANGCVFIFTRLGDT